MTGTKSVLFVVHNFLLLCTVKDVAAGIRFSVMLLPFVLVLKANEDYGEFWLNWDAWYSREKQEDALDKRIHNNYFASWRLFKGGEWYQSKDPGPTWRKHLEKDDALTRIEEHEGIIVKKD